MIATANASKKLVRKIFRGTITHQGKIKKVIFQCHTDCIEEEGLYDCINQDSVEEGYPYSVMGKNISNIELLNTRDY